MIKRRSRVGRSISLGQKLITYLYKHPVIDSKRTMEILGVSAKTAGTLLKDFEEEGILVEYTGFQRNRSYIFNEYIDFF